MKFTKQRLLPRLAIATLALGTGGVWWWLRTDAPLSMSSASTPNPLVAGDSEDAMRRARLLLRKYQEVDYDVTKVPFDMMVLPDHHMHESSLIRSERTTTFFMEGRSASPLSKEIAFTTNLYQRLNVTRYKGARTTTSPEGFWIVAFKDGRIVKVPVQNVRMIPVPGRPGELAYVFPGMAAYDPNGERMPWVKQATPPDNAFVAATKRWAMNHPVARGAAKTGPKVVASDTCKD